MPHSKVRLDLTVDAKLALAIETEQHRLHQELLRLKREGKKPQSTTVTERQVTRVALILGLDALKRLNFEEFEEQCRARGVDA